jgi:hypothetical protein
MRNGVPPTALPKKKKGDVNRNVSKTPFSRVRQEPDHRRLGGEKTVLLPATNNNQGPGTMPGALHTSWFLTFPP